MHRRNYLCRPLKSDIIRSFANGYLPFFPLLSQHQRMLRRYSRTKQNVNITDYIVFETIFECVRIQRQEDILNAVEIRGSPEIIEFRFLNDSDPFFLLLFKMGIRFWEKHFSIKVPTLTFKTNSGLHVNTSLENKKKSFHFIVFATWARQVELKLTTRWNNHQASFAMSGVIILSIILNEIFALIHTHTARCFYSHLMASLNLPWIIAQSRLSSSPFRRLGLSVPFDFE